MQSSGNTHTYTKRSVALNPPLIGGIVGVAVLFNLILAVSWWILRDRRKLKKLHKRRISGPVDCEKYEHSVAFAVSTGAIPARPTSQGKSYYSLIQALQRQPPPAVNPSTTSLAPGAPSGSTEPPGLKKLILRPQDLKEYDGRPRYPKRKSHLQTARRSGVVQLAVPPGLSRSNSLAETASVYSSASAPMDYHERLLHTQPFMLDPNAPASAPAWISHMPTPPAPAAVSKTTSFMDFDDAYPTPSSSVPSRSSTLSDASTIKPTPRTFPPAPSPIVIPSASTPTTPTTPRARTNSTPSNIRWLVPPSPASASTPSPPSSAHAHPRRPNSISSLSTIFSVQEASRVDAAPATSTVVAPLRHGAHARQHQQWGSVDMTRSTPLPASIFAPPPPLWMEMAAPRTSAPTIPARSPMRPPPSASVEHLPLSALAPVLAAS